MNRREEYWVLTNNWCRELRNWRARSGEGWSAPGGGAGGQRSCWPDWLVRCAAFVVMVNAPGLFAISCAKVLVLGWPRRWPSPSLRAAVEHDHVQYIGRDRGEDRDLRYCGVCHRLPARHTCSILWEGGVGCPGSSRRRTAPLDTARPVQQNSRKRRRENCGTRSSISARGTPGGVPGPCTVEPAGPAGKRENRAPGNGQGRRAGGGGKLWPPHVSIQLDPDKMVWSQDGGGGHLEWKGRTGRS